MRFLATYAAAAFLAVASLPSFADSITSVVVYGDSLSDNGNLFKATGQPGAPYVDGRFSNGPVAVEQLAAHAGVPLFDFAWGGATTGVGNIGDGGTPTSLGFAHLPGMLSEFALYGGVVPAAAIPTSLFVVWGGADDFESLVKPTVLDSQAAALAAVKNIDGIVGALKLEGATNILVPNLPNLSGTPEFSGNASAKAYSEAFNAALAASLPSGAKLFDTDALFSSIQATPGAYGFSNVTTPCIADGANPSCSGYLFFDDIHPTTAADAILARDFVAATPEPSSLMLLSTGVVGMVLLMGRRKAAGQVH